jgi:hypothetical protein
VESTLWGSESLTLGIASDYVDSNYWKSVDFDVPRRFFDEFVSVCAPMGHAAVYPDFDDLNTCLQANDLELLGRINFHGPWSFASASSAGWFFREKFSLYGASLPGVEPETESAVFEVLDRYLGTKSSGASTFVNWGITYAVYRSN